MELRWRPAAVALVAGRAVGRRRDVAGCLARRTRSVMAARTIGGCGEGAVVRLGTAPGAVGLVAALAARRG